MAPEVYFKKKYTTKADIWALGVVIFKTFTNKKPYVVDLETIKSKFSAWKPKARRTFERSLNKCKIYNLDLVKLLFGEGEGNDKNSMFAVKYKHRCDIKKVKFLFEKVSYMLNY